MFAAIVGTVMAALISGWAGIILGGAFRSFQIDEDWSWGGHGVLILLFTGALIISAHQLAPVITLIVSTIIGMPVGYRLAVRDTPMLRQPTV